MLSATGYFFVLIAMLVVGGILLRALAGFMKLPSESSIPIALFFLGSLHISRKDLAFLEEISVSHKDRGWYLTLEYGFLLLPFIIYQLIRGQWMTAIGLAIISLLLSWMIPSLNVLKWKSRALSLNFIPISAFELKIVIERYLIPICILWLISFFGVVHPAFLLVAFLFFLFMIIDGYTFNEPLEMISESSSFLMEKCGLHIGLVTMLFGLQFLISWFFHPDSILILLAGYGYMIIILVLAITSKYKNYDPLRPISMNSTALIIAMILGLLPGLILGSLLVAIYYYFQAKKNIAYYVG